MKVSQLQSAELAVPVSFAGCEVTLRVRIAAFTREFMSKAMPIPEALETVIAGWDLQGDDGKAFPITAAAIDAELPPLFLQAAWDAITEAISPN